MSLLILLLLHVTTCNIYTVTPDDSGDHHFYHYLNMTCHHCHNLQHYLLNVTKYFTSNTQLLFLPGVYHLHTDLIIENIHNISIIGSTDNDTTPVSAIQCYPTNDGIAIINSTIVTIRNFVFTKYEDVFYGASFDILKCYYIKLHNMVIHMRIKGYNVMGKSKLCNIISNGLNILYDDKDLVEFKVSSNEFEICNYSTQFAAINVRISATFYAVSIVITDTVFSQLLDKLAMFMVSGLFSTPYENVIIFDNIHFINNHDFEYLLYIQFALRNNCSFNTSATKHDRVIFHDSLFIDSGNVSAIVHCEWFREVKVITQALFIYNCQFTNNTYCTNILDFVSYSTTRFISEQAVNIMYTFITIANTNFTSNECNTDKHSTMVNSGNPLLLKGSYYYTW